MNDCVGKMMENMNRIIEQSQISTLEGTAYDSYLSSFSMKIQINKIVSEYSAKVLADRLTNKATICQKRRHGLASWSAQSSAFSFNCEISNNLNDLIPPLDSMLPEDATSCR